MYLYGSQPQGVIVRGHYHDSWDGVSGSSWYVDDSHFSQPIYLDLSRVICDYCGNKYLSEHLKSGVVINCGGCGATSFHFERK